MIFITVIKGVHAISNIVTLWTNLYQKLRDKIMEKIEIRQVTSDISVVCLVIIASMSIKDGITLIVLLILWTVYWIARTAHENLISSFWDSIKE